MTTRERATPAGESHEFRPERYWNTFGAHPPVLRIAAGDVVRTSTADAFGRDASGEPVAQPGNPLTGPFYVEGAERGDTLLVTLAHIRPNRGFGTANTGLALNNIEPGAIGELPERGRFDWTVDLDAGVARLERAGGAPEAMTVPLAPMLGCIGVAPDRGEAITSLRAGTFGGNMDYRAMQAGVTLQLPVFEPGALLFVGDGHAAQGDAEVVATGIEISMDVEFSVDLLKGHAIRTPRGEDAEYVFTVGNGKPFEAPFQAATTEMFRWLRDGYGFDSAGASQLLGMRGEYDIASTFTYSIVCKVPKRVLPAPR